MEQERRKVVLSGIQPTGTPTLGNYIGALRNWSNMQEGFDAYYCVANMHAITVRQNPSELRRRSIEMFALLLAIGIDPEKSVLFIQSHVPEHALLSWALCCNTYIGELSRMTQFKDKSEKHQDNINAGLFTYPVLMAADILLYQTDLVPVGDDQKQHCELTRDIAVRFNNAYGETFAVPEPYIPKVGARIMSLQQPDRKMSKSDPNPNAYILMLDEPDVIARKVRRAVTDCDGLIAADPARPGVYNLLMIYSSCTGKTVEQSVSDFAGQNYGALKNGVADAVIETLRPIQDAYKRVLSDKAYLNQLMEKGAEKAQRTAARTVRKVYHKVGLDSYKA